MQPVSILNCSYAPIELIGKAGDRDQPLLPLSRFTTAYRQLLDGLAALGNGDPRAGLSGRSAFMLLWFTDMEEGKPTLTETDDSPAVPFASAGLAALGNGDPRAGLSGRSAFMLLWFTDMEEGKPTLTEADDSPAVPFASAGLADCGNGS